MRFKYDFLIAKLHGIKSKSILGERFERLKRINSIDLLKQELGYKDSLFYYDISTYNDIEKKYREKILKQLNYIVFFFNRKHKVINSMLMRYEIENVKLIVNCYFSKQKKDPDFPKPAVLNLFDYKAIKQMDLRDFENLKKIFIGTIFEFVLSVIEEKKEQFFVENEIDKFYYKNIFDSLGYLNQYEREKLKEILIIEMNWQNIIWAFRTYIYYKKNFKNIVDSFIYNEFIINPEKFEKIFSLAFSPGEVENSLKEIFPPYYYYRILKFVKENGEINLEELEKSVIEEIISFYTYFFYHENFNVLPIIAFIYLKQVEYNNLVKLLESLRYNIRID